MKAIDRRSFLKDSASSVAAAAAATPAIWNGAAKAGPNDTIQVAVVGIRNRGKAHLENFCRMSNVNVAALCDVDERLFPESVAQVEKASGKKPKTFVDFRQLLEDRSIDAVSLATPDHWHALQTIWACQAGKDVYVEKPVSWCVEEGRRAVQAARKYNRIVQTGSQYRSNTMTQEAMRFIHEGKLGKIYMIKTFYYGFRDNIGRKPNGPIPAGVDWDLFLGPAPYRPFNENRFHYNWHWFWDTGNSDLTANGVHFVDIARWSLGTMTLPTKIHSDGGYYVFDSDQETPNIIYAWFEFEDRTMLRMEIHNLFTPIVHPEPQAEGIRVGAMFFGSEGWMILGPGEYRTYFGRDNKPGPRRFAREIAPDPMNRQGTGDEPHFVNFIDCVRSRKWQDLNADILEGHLSAAVCHLAEISYRTGRRLTFNPYREKFVADEEADAYLTRDYRHPYVLPKDV
jgi:predicted dehydrogenase